MEARDRLYIDGAWVSSTGTSTIDVIHAATEEVIGRIPEGTAQDVDRAVEAARAAFPGWSETPREQRAKYLGQITEALQTRMADIASSVASEVGTPLNLAMIIQAGLPIADFQSMIELATSFPLEERVGNSLVVREPVGVVGCITPWNYPLHQVAAKVAPAFAAGCTVVLKPSEVAPLTAFLLADVVHDIGLPPGVFNLVSGTGPVVGEAIASHADVDMVSFTGSVRAGRRVAELASHTIKRVTLELGGKSPNVILDDADLRRAVSDGLAKCYLNSGQTCSALTRMVVPRPRLREVEDIITEVIDQYPLIDPLSRERGLGPLVSAAQRDRVVSYIRKGIDEGARLVAGGPETPEGKETGFYVRPTVFSDVDSGMTIAQEEIFGPVLVILPYDSEDEAIRIANDTGYGLAGGVWSGDPDRALGFARRIRAGQVEVNGGSFNPNAPFGGYKQSGYGRELGKHGLEEYFELKAMQL